MSWWRWWRSGMPGPLAKDRGRILDEFAAVTGLHRKHAMRLLRGGMRGEQSGRRLEAEGV